jgi:hypothetical protein
MMCMDMLVSGHRRRIQCGAQAARHLLLHTLLVQSVRQPKGHAWPTGDSGSIVALGASRPLSGCDVPDAVTAPLL